MSLTLCEATAPPGTTITLPSVDILPDAADAVVAATNHAPPWFRLLGGFLKYRDNKLVLDLGIGWNVDFIRTFCLQFHTVGQLPSWNQWTKIPEKLLRFVLDSVWQDLCLL